MRVAFYHISWRGVWALGLTPPGRKTSRICQHTRTLPMAMSSSKGQQNIIHSPYSASKADSDHWPPARCFSRYALVLPIIVTRAWFQNNWTLSVPGNKLKFRLFVYVFIIKITDVTGVCREGEMLHGWLCGRSCRAIDVILHCNGRVADTYNHSLALTNGRT